MKEYDERTQTSKASQRLERTDLLLSELRTGLRIGQVPEWPTLEQRGSGGRRSGARRLLELLLPSRSSTMRRLVSLA
jgi:hypothetical protein